MGEGLTRRWWLRAFGVGAFGALVGSAKPNAAAAEDCPDPPDPDLFPDQDDSSQEILNKLGLGIQRYTNNTPVLHLRCTDQSLEIITGQAPAVMVLSCADSRVVPEYISDQPRATLFVCRVAGNFATDEVIGSLEYGAAVLGAKMLVVLGHSNCGAVASTIQLVRGTATFPPEQFGHIRTVLEGIVPAVQNVIGTVPDNQLLRRATEENARLNAARLSTQGPILSRRFASGQLGIVGAYYDIETGVPKPV